MSFGWRAALGLTLLIAVAAGFFGIAGRLDWIQGWAFVIGFAVAANALGFWLKRSNPALLEERSRRAANVEPWDRVLVRIHSTLVVTTLVVAALDAGRFRWSTVPLAAQALGWASLVVAGVVIRHAFAVNPFLSSYVRIQDDRGQTVVSSGLYGVVRHPMYVAIILWSLALPLALASAWALLPGGATALLLVYRTAREDRTLREKLPGYGAYAERVRHRLIPGIW